MATDAKGVVDDKLLKELERYDTPGAVNQARIEARARISAGLAPKELPANATAEEIAAYRVERGIPETPDKYDLTLPDGLVVGEADKPLIDNYLKAMHGEHATPAEVKRAVTWYYKQADAIREQTENTDAQYKKDNIDVLRDKWGPEFRRNIGIYEEFKASLPQDLQEQLAAARGSDGRLLMANATFLQWMVNQERARNPIATVVSGGGPGALAAAETELAALTKESADTNGPYWKGPDAGKKQERMRALIEATTAAKKT